MRDAIRTSRALGIPYLWVDALCIIQDDPSDWNQQCIEMDKIYKTSLVTVCAVSSRSCHEGFLSPSGPHMKFPFKSHLRPEIKGFYNLQFKYAVDRNEEATINTLVEFDKRHCRWASRAWVFQEWRLSRRRMVFGKSGLHFICSGGTESMGIAEYSKRRWSPHPDPPVPDEDALSRMSTREALDCWDLLLSDYSKFGETSLTNSSDIFPALAGLAKAFHRHLDDEYICGYWNSNLTRSLMWYNHRSFSLVARVDHMDWLRSSVHTTPSWSCLLHSSPTDNVLWSLPLGAQIREEYQRLLAEIVNTAGHRFGSVVRARIHLTNTGAET